ncbi:hypothetical protein Pmar_PMAR010486 [Perkinsus marinus ATCC 50983]|uniref:Uncharacterized protein n=2 Tax=Perkinsus marinus (strain ATCC 50983 / TXsc) TaxID=423536 RepID=C5LDJ1_PERM5|nr:hypothetical protein Pmar_PMAR010486 [Perkinsus marinus ATCC 50983]EER05202.1 hypothetical protein Pmar_PMAR010486 [Perkinsus marinus ATCC 50983]|eukprot:XP_002773386.1 hypothetical protein Pmar_PMAR010486 [Perkinsus marinus ATCC 50983]
MPYTYGLLVLAIMTQATLGQSEGSFQVTADYPAGCHGGPGPGRGSVITTVMEPSCIYSKKGVTSDGVYKEAAGIILKTNRPGHFGSMHVNFTVFTTPDNKSGTLVETYGWAHLSVGDETRDFWWNPAPGEDAYGPGSRIHIATIDYGYFPKYKVNIWNSWHALEGSPDCQMLHLISNQRASSNVHNPSFSTGQQIRISKKDGGWDFLVVYQFRDTSPQLDDYTKYVIQGNLKDIPRL